MDSLKDIISDIRVFLYGGIQKFPLTIAGTLLIIGLFTANYAILFFLLGFLIVTPLATALLNTTIGPLLDWLLPSAFTVKTSDICRVIVPFTTLESPLKSQEENVVFSPWLAMVVFFVGYLFTNGLELFNREATDVRLNVTTTSQSDIEKKTTTRKSQAMIAMVSTLLFALIIIGFRIYSGCESVLGMVVTSIAFMFGGYGWYRILASVGEDRLSDLFGIANRLLPPSAIENKPIACLPIRV